MAGAEPENLNCVLATGTNGKGSVCAMLESILRESGLKTGFYSSPHFVSYCERFKINGKDIPEKEFCALVSEIKPLVESYNRVAIARSAEAISTFEALSVMAFLLFALKKVDFCVFEVGMGGRLDATNVVAPKVSVVTNVALEHTQALGNTVEKIAKEKAGVVRKGGGLVTAASGKALEVLEKICKQKHAKILIVGPAGIGGSGVEFSLKQATLSGTELKARGAFGEAQLKTRLLGGVQAENAAVAFAVAKVLQKKQVPISNEAILKGLLRAKWPGRFEIVSRKPLVIFDGCHNPAGAFALARFARELLSNEKIFLVIAVMKDKNVAKVVQPLASIACKVFATRVAIGRSATPVQIARLAKKSCGNVRTVDSAQGALAQAVKEARKENAVVLVAGSLYLIGELKKFRAKT